MKWFYSIALAMATALTGAAQAPSSTHVNGVVTGVNPGSNQVTLQTERGDSLVFTVNERTQIFHAKAGITEPKDWPKMAVSDIAVGDKALAAYRGSADQKPLLATSLVIRTKADLSELGQEQEQDWKKRGTNGVVSAVDSAAKTISLKIGARSLTVQANEKTAFHRYAPDSAAAADALPSSLAEVKVGDQLKVLGNRTADGTTIAAEIVYAGSFRQIAALIVSIDAAAGELRVTDLDNKKPLSLRITKDTTMRKLPPEMAQMLARRYQAGRGTVQARGEGQAGAASGPERSAAGGAGGGRGDVNAMLDGLPALQLSELKAKDAIMVTTTMGSNPQVVTATFLLAGVEDVLRAAPTATRDLMSGWNMGGGEEGP